MSGPNFVLLDATLPDVTRLVAAMVQARDAVESRSWSHPQEPTTEEWWADVLADPRAQIRKRRSSDLAVAQTFYRLADELRDIILVACSKCEWKAAWRRRVVQRPTHARHPARPGRQLLGQPGIPNPSASTQYTANALRRPRLRRRRPCHDML